MPHSLTDRQRAYLDFISEFIAANERSPKLNDIANHFKVKPPSAHKMLETLQKKGFLLFGRDSHSGFFIRLVERAGTAEIVTEVNIVGKIDKYGEVLEFPKIHGHFATVLAGANADEIFCLLASDEIPQARILLGDALIFDYSRKAKPGDICIAPLGDRLFLIRIVSKTFNKDFLSDVMASDYPIPEDFTNPETDQLINWYPLAYDEKSNDHFMGVMQDQELLPRELQDDLILATAIRLSRQLSI